MAGGADGSSNSSFPHVALNERILSSMSRKSIAAHPWHDLEIEMARQQRHSRKRRQKWLWGTIGLTITLGTAALARSYFRDSSHLQRKEGDSPVGDVN